MTRCLLALTTRQKTLYSALRRNSLKFVTTDAKDEIREFMKGKICDLEKRKGKKLHYFGLPSLDFLDVRCWYESIDCVTSVEIEKSIYLQQSEVFASLNIDASLTTICADVDDVITDLESCVVNMQNHMDIVFLDYYDDLLSSQYNRIEVIKILLEKQLAYRNQKFLLSFSHHLNDENSNFYNTSLKDDINLETDFDKYGCSQIEDMMIRNIVALTVDTCIKTGYGLSSYDLHLYRQNDGRIRTHHTLEMINDETALSCRVCELNIYMFDSLHFKKIN